LGVVLGQMRGGDCERGGVRTDGSGCKRHIDAKFVLVRGIDGGPFGVLGHFVVELFPTLASVVQVLVILFKLLLAIFPGLGDSLGNPLIFRLHSAVVRN